MSNYNKSFNFRNGVQVDEDDLIVRGSLVGIGTTIPRSELDVRGNIEVSGMVTSTYLYNSGIATFTTINVGAGISLDGTTGIISATFYGDGSNLVNIPTSQWVDVDPGFGFTSIYSAGNVGVATTNPSSTFQVGGRPEEGDAGVGISSGGNINATGIITGGFLVGSGASITNINASNIASGTLNADRFPVNISIVGVATIANIDSPQIISTGVANLAQVNATQVNVSGFSTLNSAQIGNVTVSGGSTIGVASITSAVIDNLVVSGITTSTGGFIGNLTGNVTGNISGNISGNVTGNLTGEVNAAAFDTNSSGIVVTGDATVTNNLNVTGIATVGILTTTAVHVGFGTILSVASVYNNVTGITTSVRINSGSVQIGYGGTNEIDTTYGNLVLDSASGTTQVDDNLSVTGDATVSGTLYANTAVVPDTDLGATLGNATTYFSSAYIGEVNVGSATSNTITTRSNNLVLDSATGTTKVNDRLEVENNLLVSGSSYLTGITTVGQSLVPDSDQSAEIGSSSLRFSAAYVDNVRIGVGSDNEVSTGSGNLKLNSSSGIVEVANGLNVSGQTYLTGISTVETGLLPDQNKSAYLGSSSKSFTEAYINEVRIGSGGDGTVDTKTGDLVLSSNSGTVEVSQSLEVGQSSTLSGNLHVGTDGNKLFVDQTNNRIGIGTSSLSSDIEINRNGNLNVELVSKTGTALVAIGQSTGIGNQSATISYGNESLAISNNSESGSIDINLSAGSGINTSAQFNIKHKGVSLVSVGYSGFVGINKNTPEKELDIIGDLGVVGNAVIDGSLTVGVGASQFTLGSGVFGSDIISSGISTFAEVEITNKVSVGATISVTAGIGSFSEGIGIGTGRPIDSAKLSIVGDYTGDGSILLLSDANRIGIGTAAFQNDSRNLSPGGVDSGYPGIGYGNLQVFGSSTFFGDSIIFVYSGGLLDNSSLDLKYYDTRALTDSRYQANIGINTHIPRSSLDAGCSGGYFIPPSHIESTKQNFIDNPLNSSFYNIGAVVPGALIFYEPKNRLEVGIGTEGAFCGIATLTYNSTGLDAFVPPKMTTTQRNSLTTGGIPDGAIIYNTSTNKLQLRAASAWVDLN